jgi:hypothetical protein
MLRGKKKTPAELVRQIREVLAVIEKQSPSDRNSSGKVCKLPLTNTFSVAQYPLTVLCWLNPFHLLCSGS